MTPAFKHITNALNIVLDSFASLQTASGRAIDLNNINAARRELLAVNTSIVQTESSIRRSATAQEKMNNKLKNGTSAANGLLQKVGGIAAAYATLQSAGDIVNMADQYADAKSRLDIMNKGLQTTDELQKMVMESANSTFSNYQDTVDMVGKLGVQAGEAFSNNQDIINFAEQINKHLKVSGTNAAAASGSMLQLTQAMGSGVLRGEELNSVMEGMPTVYNAIKKYFSDMGDTRGIKKIAEEGQITADIVKAALYNAADDTNAKFAKMTITFSNVWNVFKNKANEAFKPVFEKLNSISNSKGFQNFMLLAAQGVSTLAGVIVWAFDAMGSIANFVIQNWGLIAPIFWGVTAAVVAYNAALFINWTRQKAAALWTAAVGVATAIKTVSTWAEVKANLAATAAQWGLNTALLACPITWIIAGVIAVITVIYLVVAAINHFKGTSISATGIIAGTFMVLGYHIYNVVAFLWNRFAAFAEFLFNIFQHPIYAIKALFVNLATNFLDITIAMTKGWDGFATSFANAIISAVNMAIGAWNKFVDLMPDKVKNALGIGKAGKIEVRTSITSDMQAMKGNLRDWLGDKPAGYWSAPRMGMKTVSEGWNKGYNWGSNLSNKFSMDKLMKQAQGAQASIASNGSKALNENAGLGSGGLGGSNPIKDLAGSSKQTAANTGAMANNLQGTEEEIKYLREIGEREAINRFTTAEIKIDMKNDNHISNGLDLDGVINGLTERVYAAMSIAAEGVHK